MNKDDIVEAARQAGFVINDKGRQYQPNCITHTWHMIDEGLVRFAEIIRNKTLEDAAKKCDGESLI